MTTSQSPSSAGTDRPKPRFLAPLLLLAAAATFGMVSRDDGQLEAAIAAQHARVAMEPSATDLNDLANLLVVRGDLDQAEQAYREALALAPESIEVPYNLALLLQHLERDREALKLFRGVVKKVPDAAWAHLQIGVLAADLGKRRQAVRSFSKAFALEPRLASPRINPHLAGRPEVLKAMLNASSNARAPQTAPLSFSEPDRIARLLVGESAAARAAARSIERRGLVEPAEPNEGGLAEPTKQVRRLEVEGLPESAQSESKHAARLPARAEPTEPVPSGAGEKDRAVADERAQRRVVGVEDLRAVRGAGAASQASGRGGRSRSGGTTSVRPSGGNASPAGGRTSRFRPGGRSSVRLELHELPTEQRPVSRWATLSEAP